MHRSLKINFKGLIKVDFKGIVITYGDKQFGIALVNYSDFRHLKALQAVKQYGISYFKDLPFLIACEDASGNPLYYGDQDLIQLLDEINPSCMTWKVCLA